MLMARRHRGEASKQREAQERNAKRERDPERHEGGIAGSSGGSVRSQREVAEVDEARRALQRLLCPRQNRACAEEIWKDEAFFLHPCVDFPEFWWT